MNGLSIPVTPQQARIRVLAIAAACIFVALAALPLIIVQRLGMYMVLFPLTAGVVAVALYVISRPLYVAYTLWVWFLTPFLRRIHDYLLGAYHEQSLILTAPYLVGAVGFMGLIVVLTQEERGVRQAFWLVVGSLFYGAVIGAAFNGVTPVVQDAADWGLSIALGALLLSDWQQYPRYRDLVLRTLTLAMAVLGLYGLYQFFFLPEWDRMWMEGSAMASVGQPLPMRVRVFGTLNSPQPFGVVMMVGLLALFAVSGQGAGWTLLARVAAVPAAASLLLSQSRTQWGGLVVGVLYIMLRVKARSRRAIMVYVALAALAAVPIGLSSSFVGVVGDEFESLLALGSDNSLSTRMNLYAALPGMMMSAPQGGGLGSVGRAARSGGGGGGGSGAGGPGGASGGSSITTTDSGIVAIGLTLGWVSLVYLTGLGLLVFWMLRVGRESVVNDRFVVVSAGMAVAALSTIPLAHFFIGIGATCIWGFLCLSLAGARYYRHQAASAGVAAPTEGLLPPRRAG